MMTTTEKKKLIFFLIVLESFQFIQAVPSSLVGFWGKKLEDIKEKAKLTATSLIVCRQRQTNYLKKT